MKRRQQPQRNHRDHHLHESQRPRRRSARLTARAHPPLLDALRPLLSHLHSFLSDDDAARLLRTSRTTALTLLPSYAFTRHVFQPASLASLRRLRELCLAYRLRIAQLDLPHQLTAFACEPALPHLSPIPASVTSLALGSFNTDVSQSGDQDAATASASTRRWAAFRAAADDWQDSAAWRLPRPNAAVQEGRREWAWESSAERTWSCLPWSCRSLSGVDCPLAPGLLPSGLRLLLLPDYFHQPLQPGSLPSALTFLQLGHRFDQPLAPGVLPASLLYLCLAGDVRDHALLQRALPASLERLRLNWWSHPLQPGLWPPGLKALHLGRLSRPLVPHVLPSSLLYLSLHHHEHPLLPHALPSSLVELDLDGYDQPLPPGVLPSSVRRLMWGGAFRQALQVGSLPEGLLSLAFHPRGAGGARLPPLLPGVLPSTLLSVDFADRYEHPLPANIIPPSVRWIRLSISYRDARVEAVLPPCAVRCWWRDQGSAIA